MKIETRKKVFVRDFFTCRRCGKAGANQLAHRIHSGKESCRYIQNFISSRYGVDLTKTFINEDILNHPDNLVVACSLPCNDSFNIFYKPVQRDKLIIEIYESVTQSRR
jgi:hypothetical protein